MSRIFTIICAAIIVAAGLSACGAAPVPTTTAQPSVAAPGATPDVKHPRNPGGDPSAAPGRPLVTVKASGGLCHYGACWTTTEIAADGSYHTADGTGDNRSGALSADAAAALSDLVGKANFAEIASHPFTGTCPIAYDGQELVYTFHTAAGDQAIASCQVEIDPASPLFQALTEALVTIRR